MRRRWLRLSGEVIEHVCCRHLYGTDRVLTVWLADDHAVVIAIGRHDESADDVYSGLLDALELEVPDAEREKPPCCDDTGRPPSDEHGAAVIAEAVERVGRRVRRQRR